MEFPLRLVSFLLRGWRPAPGFRDAGNNKGCGTLYAVGENGYSWSSTIAGSNARFLSFRYGGLNPQLNSTRAYGLPLRCLQEEGEGCWHSKAGFFSAELR